MLEKGFYAVLGQHWGAWVLGPSGRTTAWGVLSGAAYVASSASATFASNHPYLTFAAHIVTGGLLVKTFREAKDWKVLPAIPERRDPPSH